MTPSHPTSKPTLTNGDRMSRVTRRLTLVGVLSVVPLQATPLSIEDTTYTTQSVLCKQSVCISSEGRSYRLFLEDGIHRVELPSDTSPR